MTYAEDRADLARHEAEIAARATFNYALLDDAETQLFGCVYVDPPEQSCPPGSDALVSLWVVDSAVGTDLERALDAFVPGWLRDSWGLRSVHICP